jgi:hypothetical protein
MITDINITEFKKKYCNDLHKFSNSVVNSGREDIWKVTWNNARECEHQFVSRDTKKAILNYFKEMGGGWDDVELNDNNFLNALFIQEVSAQLQEEEAGNIIVEGEETYFVF